MLNRGRPESVFAVAVIAFLFAGCATEDIISQAERGEREKPGFAETRAIAEEGFIYGLPLVMNYAVMYENIRGHGNSRQCKAPFNTLFNEHRVFTYKDTTVVTPNSDTPYSFALAGPPRRTLRGLRARRGEGAVLLGAC